MGAHISFFSVTFKSSGAMDGAGSTNQSTKRQRARKPHCHIKAPTQPTVFYFFLPFHFITHLSSTSPSLHHDRKHSPSRPSLEHHQLCCCPTAYFCYCKPTPTLSSYQFYSARHLFFSYSITHTYHSNSSSPHLTKSRSQHSFKRSKQPTRTSTTFLQKTSTPSKQPNPHM